MTDEERELVERLCGDEMQRLPMEPPSASAQPQTIPYTDLPEDTSQSPGATEWNHYRREVGRLLAQGHEGKWVLIKGVEVIGIWESRDEAKAVALERYLMQPILIRQVLSREPLLRGPTFWRLCPS
jgi:hypothetical protein